MMVWLPHLSLYKGASGGAIQGVAYGMISFHGGYNEWHILIPCKVAQCDWYHRHMLNYAFGTGGMTMSDITISSWCSTERQEDTSESAVFHFLLLGVWDRCLFACVLLLQKKKWVGSVALRSPINRHAFDLAVFWTTKTTKELVSLIGPWCSLLICSFLHWSYRLASVDCFLCPTVADKALC